MPVPPRPLRGPPTALPLHHLQGLLGRCRPHQQHERRVLACMVQHRALSQHVLAPLQALLELGQQGQQQGEAVQLRLTACSTTGRLTYGSELDGQLGALLAAEWSPFLAAGCSLSVQAELADGSLTAEAVAAAVASGSGGPLVALCVPRRQLLVRGSGVAAMEGTVGDAPHTGGDPAAAAAADPFGDGPPDEEQQQELWVTGRLVSIPGKRLRTALDFGAGQAPQERQPAGNSGDGASSTSQRTSLAVVQVLLLPQAGSLDGTSAAMPGSLELQWPCDQLWRLMGPSASVLSGSSGGGGIRSGGGGGSEHAPNPPQPQLLPPRAPSSLWDLSGYCSGAAAFSAASTAPASVGDSLRHKAPAGQPGQQQQQGAAVQASRPAATSVGGISSSGSALLLCIQLQHIELSVLAHLSGQPELQAACRRAGSGGSGGSGNHAYDELSNYWAAAARQLEVPGSGGGGGAGGGAAGQQPGVLICAGTAEAAVLCLVHGWSTKKLAGKLQCSKQAAAAVLDSLLAAFPLLKAWLGQAAAAGEASCCAATLTGRQRQFVALKRADDAMVSGLSSGLQPPSCAGCLCASTWTAHDSLPTLPLPLFHCCFHPQGRGKLHRAILLHMLGGSLADVLKAALVCTHASLGALPAASARAPPGSASSMQQRPEVALVLGHSIVVLLPPAFTAAHSGGAAAAAGAVAAAVRRGLGSLYVGRAQLAAPPAAAITVGRTLHPLDQQPVGPAPAAQQQRW